MNHILIIEEVLVTNDEYEQVVRVLGQNKLRLKNMLKTVGLFKLRSK